MLTETKRTDLFCEYYAKWITVYKKGAIRKVTMDKYLMTQKWLVKLVPNLRVCDMNRIAYQQLLNDYAEFHEHQTTMDFHHQLKGAILDAVDEGLIERDPTRKAIIKGKPPVAKKIKYLNQFELHTLLISLDLKDKVNWDYFILLVAKTGMRFSEALALTPKDSDFAHQTLSISKTCLLYTSNADLQNGWVCPRIWTTQITKKADAGDLIMSVRAPAGAMGKTCLLYTSCSVSSFRERIPARECLCRQSFR